MWEVIRPVLKSGGDINDGAAVLDAALQENLTVVSVYGGDESTAHVHAPPDHALGGQAGNGRFRVQGRNSDEGVLRDRRSRFQGRLSPSKELFIDLGVRHRDSRGADPQRHLPWRRLRDLGVGFAIILASPAGSTSRMPSPTRSPRTWCSRSRIVLGCRSGSRSLPASWPSRLRYGDRALHLPAAPPRAGDTVLLAIFVASLGIAIAGENVIRLSWGSSSENLIGWSRSSTALGRSTS